MIHIFTLIYVYFTVQSPGLTRGGQLRHIVPSPDFPISSNAVRLFTNEALIFLIFSFFVYPVLPVLRKINTIEFNIGRQPSEFFQNCVTII